MPPNDGAVSIRSVEDASLLDTSIADKLIVEWNGGRCDSADDNIEWADPWPEF
jgi:hypothetical protein